MAVRIATLLVLTALFSCASAVARAADHFLGRSAAEWEQALAGSDKKARLEAAWACAMLSESAADQRGSVERLRKLVADSDPAVRYWGAVGAGRQARKVAGNEDLRKELQQIVAPLLTDKSAAPRVAAAEVIGLLGDADKAVAVLTAAMNDAQDATRIQAAMSLEALGPASRSAKGTLEAGTRDSTEYVKRISERTLRNLSAGKN